MPELTERANFREVLLKGRLAAALRKLNLRDGQPWLDDDCIHRIILLHRGRREGGRDLREHQRNRPLVTLRYFGPEVNPDAPEMAAYKKSRFC